MKLPLLILLVASLGFGADSKLTFDHLMAVRTATPQALSRDGHWLVVSILTARDRLGVNNHRFGDVTYANQPAVTVAIVDTKTGASRSLFEGRKRVSDFVWSPDGKALAYYLHADEGATCNIWNRETGLTTVASGVIAATNSEPVWSPDSQSILIPNRDTAWLQKAREKFKAQTEAPIVVYSAKDQFLPWDQVRRMNADRGLVSFNLAAKSITTVVPVGRYNQQLKVTDDGSTLLLRRDISKKTDYDVIFGADDELIARSLASGSEERKLIASTKGMNLVWSGNGKRYAYLREGKLFAASIEEKEAKQIAGKKGSEADKKPPEDEKDKKAAENEVFTPVRLSFTGDNLVASNKQGLWLMNSSDGSKVQIVKISEEDKTGPRYSVAGWSPDGDTIFLTYSARTKWDRGLVRYRVGTQKLEELFKDGNLYPRFDWSYDGSTLVFTSSSGNRPLDIWTANADGSNRRRLVESNPQLSADQLGRTELVSYLNADGKTMFGVLFYPLGYEPGRKYPTVFSVYEQFFDDTFRADIAFLNANGYAVMEPSVDFETGFPGEAWVKAVTAAANKLIDMGVADGDKLGVHGISYGGYATNLLITQTNRFKAAINISGKVNMVSFYTDSPRLGVRNIHAPEKSQDRIGATLWQQPQKYIAHSAIMFADRIKTPLLLMSGEQDHNVPARQAMEMFYALKRLGKEVEWVSYTNSGHGAPSTNEAELKDYYNRILNWYDDHLKKAASTAEKKLTTDE
jgi:dipeptidyl aminopeptidase/acylaminoacyl peptidase